MPGPQARVSSRREPSASGKHKPVEMTEAGNVREDVQNRAAAAERGELRGRFEASGG